MKEYNLKLDYYSLLNLHKALLEVKFHTMPENESVAGSPLVADLYIQIRDLLIESQDGNQWKDWFQLSNRPDRRNQAILLMQKCNRWDRATADEKRKIARHYLAPFLFDDEELQHVIAEADKRRKECPMNKDFPINRFHFSNLIEQIQRGAISDRMTDGNTGIEFYGGDTISKEDFIDLLENFNQIDNLAQDHNRQEYEKHAQLDVKNFQFEPSWVKIAPDHIIVGYVGIYVNAEFSLTFSKINDKFVFIK